MRVAYVSPLPPAASGIADYSAELLPHLARHLDLELFPPPDGPPPERRLAGCFPVRPWRELADPGLDLRLYHLGNNHHFHGAILRALVEHPGVVVLHEYVLHHMVREMTMVAGDRRGYVEAMRRAYGRIGASLAERAIDTGVPLDPWAWPLFEPAVDAALGVIVHSETTRRRVLASRPAARVAVVPHHVSVGVEVDAGATGDPEAGRRAARGRLGLADDVFLVGTFGFQTPPKRLDVLLAAFARLRAERPRARLAVVGAVDRRIDLGGLLAAGLGEAVTVVGHVGDLDTFLDWMRAIDVAVNLRHPSGGETSGTVIRLLGLGKPLIVTDGGAFAEIPDGCAAKVAPDDREEEVLAAYLIAFAAEPALARSLGEAARRHMAEHHSLAGSARRYAELLAAVAEAPRAPAPAVPPIAPWAAEDLATEVIASLATDAADLGLDERDEDLLAELARPLVDLDLDLALPAAPAAPEPERGRRLAWRRKER